MPVFRACGQAPTLRQRESRISPYLSHQDETGGQENGGGCPLSAVSGFVHR